MVLMGEWSGKVALLAGGAGGIGSATAAAFLGAGASVMLADQEPQRLQNAAERLAASGAVAIVATDLTQVSECARMVEATLSRFGRLDVLVNAAGVWVEGPSEAMTEAEWDGVVDVNLKGTFFACRHAIPALTESRGSIVNVASDAGLVGNAGAAIYSASKGGVVLLTKALALELAPRGIRVNAICPADVETPMLAFQAQHYGGGDPERYRQALLAKYPQKAAARFLTPTEVAGAILVIASPRMAPMTGAAIPLDFGMTAGY
jgi:NAD(P)-dependent dehydrogenase (short-subunit alcohol dehydrogenase family)